ncbi:MAG: universal stress protein [Actinomycetota bacterium]
MGRIVVGVDGSDDAQQALVWAISEARLRKDGVTALFAWTYPAAVGPFEAIVPASLNVDFGKEGDEIVQRAIKEATAGATDVEVNGEVVEMPPAQALLRASEGADLVVIGSRGLGGFRGLLLGSVGHQVAQHAQCPVVIIPHGERVAASGQA